MTCYWNYSTNWPNGRTSKIFDMFWLYYWCEGACCDSMWRTISRVKRASESQMNHGAEAMTLYCPKREATCEVAIAMPSSERIEEIQQQLSDLLIAGAE